MTATNKKLTVMLDPALIKELKIYALEADLKIPEIMEKMILDFLRNNRAKSDT
jgi:hypothetical protein